MLLLFSTHVFMSGHYVLMMSLSYFMRLLSMVVASWAYWTTFHQRCNTAPQPTFCLLWKIPHFFVFYLELDTFPFHSRITVLQLYWKKYYVALCTLVIQWNIMITVPVVILFPYLSAQLQSKFLHLCFVFVMIASMCSSK